MSRPASRLILANYLQKSVKIRSIDARILKQVARRLDANDLEKTNCQAELSAYPPTKPLFRTTGSSKTRFCLLAKKQAELETGQLWCRAR